MSTVLGLIRDFIVALAGVLILFGAHITKEQISGVVLLVSTAVALGTWLYSKAHKP